MNEEFHFKYPRLPFFAVGIIIVLIVFPFGLFLFQPKKSAESTTLPSAILTQTAFENVKLSAQAAYVYDLAENQPLYSYNSSAKLPLASITKLMTALVARELAPPDTVIVITPEAIAIDGGSGLLSGERWKLSDLLDFTLIKSSNAGAAAIAEALSPLAARVEPQAFLPTPSGDRLTDNSAAFVSAMNVEANNLSLHNTYFLNPTGLDISPSQAGAFGSAEDIAKLLTYIARRYPRILEATTYQSLSITSLSGIKHLAKNTDTIGNDIPSLIGSKTGYTDLAGGNLAVAFDAGLSHPIVAVVLGSSVTGRFSDMEQLVSASFATLAGVATSTIAKQ